MQFRSLSLAILAALTCVSAQAATTTPPKGDRTLVVFKSEKLPADAVQRVTRNGGTVVRSLGQVGVMTVVGNATFITKMKKDSTVLAVGPESMFSKPTTTQRSAKGLSLQSSQLGPTVDDEGYFLQWDMRRINAPAVWDRLPVAESAPRVAVLDTGVMDDHPDLDGQVAESISTAYCTTSGGTYTSDGYPIYSKLINFDTTADCEAATTDYAGHGTHVAGTIAAKFGGGAVVGVAPDAQIGAYKVFDRYKYLGQEGYTAFDTPIFMAIVDATLKHYPVISMSLGSTIIRNGKSTDGNASWLAWDRIAKWANRNGTLIVASAGNSALNANGRIAHIPGDLSTVMNISATGSNYLYLDDDNNFSAMPGSDVLAFYSNYGSAVDLAAPGGDCGPAFPEEDCLPVHLILNTYICAIEDGCVGGAGTAEYFWLAGTSMATPHVSAVAAYTRSIHPTWTPGAVRSFLKDTAEVIGPRQSFGAGMVDADAAAQ